MIAIALGRSTANPLRRRNLIQYCSDANNTRYDVIVSASSAVPSGDFASQRNGTIAGGG
ncbi:hypothetical protein D3C83_221230 [compost metagenome]